MSVIDIYSVGWLDAWQRGRIRAEWRYFWVQVRRGQWRAVKNTFNGYLAEPDDFPNGLTRCGSGWTRHRALSDLNRRIAAAGAPVKETDHE